MKRAKIMLIAIAAVAAVGGALAFKAQKFNLQNVYCKNAAGTCQKKAFKTIDLGDAFYTTPCIGVHPVAFTSSYYTTNTCPTPIQVFKVTDESNQ